MSQPIEPRACRDALGNRPYRRDDMTIHRASPPTSPLVAPGEMADRRLQR